MLFRKREHPSMQPLSIIHYQRRDRRAVLDLIEHSHRVHTHLDWYETDSWLDTLSELTWTAWQGTRLVALLGISQPLKGASWIRLAAFHSDADVSSLLNSLWNTAVPQLQALGVESMALLITNDWITPFAEGIGFRPFDEIITLRRVSTVLPSITSSNYLVRSFLPHELNTLVDVDQQAFAAPWQMSAQELKQAERFSANVTVAIDHDRIVGYQLSTLYFDGAHLARLAVLPSHQGKGVGRALMTDLVHRFARRSIYTVSVNTQLTNTHSQNLYHRFDFHRTGYDLRVWSCSLR